MNATTRLTASDIGPWFSTHHHTEPEFAEYLADLLEEAFSDPPPDLLSDLRDSDSETLDQAIWEAIDALNAIAPENTYFGVSECYGDFGLWYDLETLDYTIGKLLAMQWIPERVKLEVRRLREFPEPWLKLPEVIGNLRKLAKQGIQYAEEAASALEGLQVSK